MDPALAEMAAVQELLPDPVLENVGRHLPLSGMRTCRLVCKRWAAVIGESVKAVGVSAELLRSTVLGDQPPPAAAGKKEGAAAAAVDDDVDSDDSCDEATPASRLASSTDPSVGGSRRRPTTAAAMRRLRRLSRQLARAFPRAHTCVLHIDVG